MKNYLQKNKRWFYTGGKTRRYPCFNFYRLNPLINELKKEKLYGISFVPWLFCGSLHGTILSTGKFAKDFKEKRKSIDQIKEPVKCCIERWDGSIKEYELRKN